jgi:hypothetical protein
LLEDLSSEEFGGQAGLSLREKMLQMLDLTHGRFQKRYVVAELPSVLRRLLCAIFTPAFARE